MTSCVEDNKEWTDYVNELYDTQDDPRIELESVS